MIFLILISLFLFLLLMYIDSLRFFNPIIQENIYIKLKLISAIILIEILIVMYVQTLYYPIK